MKHLIQKYLFLSMSIINKIFYYNEVPALIEQIIKKSIVINLMDEEMSLQTDSKNILKENKWNILMNKIND